MLLGVHTESRRGPVGDAFQGYRTDVSLVHEDIKDMIKVTLHLSLAFAMASLAFCESPVKKEKYGWWPPTILFLFFEFYQPYFSAGLPPRPEEAAITCSPACANACKKGP